VVYEPRSEESVLSCMHEEGQRMKNSILNKIWTLWIHHYVIWAQECLNYLSETHQWHIERVSQWFCDHISQWYSDLFKQPQDALWTHAQDSSKAQWTSYVCEKIKKQIWNQEDTVSRICHLI